MKADKDKTDTRRQGEGVWAGEAIKFRWLYETIHRVKDSQSLYLPQLFLLYFPVKPSALIMFHDSMIAVVPHT